MKLGRRQITSVLQTCCRKNTKSHDHMITACGLFDHGTRRPFATSKNHFFLGNWNFCISVWDCENRFRLNRKCLAKEISFMLLFKAVNTKCNQLKVYLSLLEGEKLQSLPDCSADKLKIDFFGIGKVVVFFVCRQVLFKLILGIN